MEGVLTLLALVDSCFAVVDHVALQVFAVVGNVLADGTLEKNSTQPLKNYRRLFTQVLRPLEDVCYDI